jgi:hypothetical protein
VNGDQRVALAGAGGVQHALDLLHGHLERA